MRTFLRRSLWSLLLLAVPLSAQAPAVDAPDPEPTEAGTEETTTEEAATEQAATSLPAQLTVELDRQEITVGGRVKATVTLVWMGAEPSAAARFPIWQETWGDAEVLDSSDLQTFVDQSGRHIYRQELQLTAFKVGEMRLPSIEVALPLDNNTVNLRTEGAATFEVTSVLPPEPQTPAGPARSTPGSAPGTPPGTLLGTQPGTQPGTPPDATTPEPPELRPAAPPRDLPQQPLFWWTAGLLALACALATVAVDRRLQIIPESSQAQVPALPPYEEFVQHLTAVDPSDAEPAHTALSLSLRRYLGRRLGFQAAESTTSELQRRLRDTPVANAGSQPLIQLFRACDQVKFARQQVAPEATRERLRKARQLALDIEERMRPRQEDPEVQTTPDDPTTGRAA